MTNITYVYSGNRKNRYYQKKFEAREFFYGLNLFDNENINLEIIEPINNNFPPKIIFKYLDKIFQKIFNLPVYMNVFISIENIKILLKTDKLILVNETTYCSLAPLLWIIKLFKRIDVYVFVMGLYSKKLRFPMLKRLHFFIIKLFNLSVKKLMFLGEGELKKALKIHKSNKNKFILFPFSIDTEFWNDLQYHKSEINDNILFVGNDGNRDPELFLEIVDNLKEINFTAITNIENLLDAERPNLSVINGSFGSSNLSDTELKQYYLSSKLVILPLRESSQPSGQSVALQALSCGTQVIISDTEGFWDRDNFKNNNNIYFVKENNYKSWSNKINQVLSDEKNLKITQKHGQELVFNLYTLENFKHKLLEIIELDKNIIK
jgi:glycosyltransferase involved in cell wall biosynthesis